MNGLEAPFYIRGLEVPRYSVNEVFVDGKKINVKDGVDVNFEKLELT